MSRLLTGVETRLWRATVVITYPENWLHYGIRVGGDRTEKNVFGPYASQQAATGVATKCIRELRNQYRYHPGQKPGIPFPDITVTLESTPLDWTVFRVEETHTAQPI